MSQTIQHIAQTLKRDIEQNATQGAKTLIDFAKQYAATNKLKHEALILKLSYTKAPEQEQQQIVQTEMLDLVNKIVQDHLNNAQSEATVAQQAAVQKVEQYFAEQNAPKDIVFEANGIHKTYKRSGFSLRDINLQLHLGEIVSVVGENGNGKTTLLNIVAGELLNDNGKLTYPAFEGGKAGNITWYRVKENIAYIPQELPAWGDSLKQMIQFEAAIHGIRGKDNDLEVDYIIQRLGLEEHLNKRWRELSGGFKLRFALAKALVWKPKLLIIDEPLANLDIKTQLIVLKDLRNMASSFRYPMAILLSSQHLHEIESVSDKILFLKQGEVSFYGALDQLGAARQYNTFEFNTDLNTKTLKQRLANLPYQKLYHTGISHVITTDLNINYAQLLQYFLDNDIPLHYFRNISQSVKKLFDL